MSTNFLFSKFDDNAQQCIAFTAQAYLVKVMEIESRQSSFLLYFGVNFSEPPV